MDDELFSLGRSGETGRGCGEALPGTEEGGRVQIGPGCLGATRLPGAELGLELQPWSLLSQPRPKLSFHSWLGWNRTCATLARVT